MPGNLKLTVRRCHRAQTAENRHRLPAGLRLVVVVVGGLPQLGQAGEGGEERLQGGHGAVGQPQAAHVHADEPRAAGGQAAQAVHGHVGVPQEVEVLERRAAPPQRDERMIRQLGAPSKVQLDQRRRRSCAAWLETLRGKRASPLVSTV